MIIESVIKLPYRRRRNTKLRALIDEQNMQRAEIKAKLARIELTVNGEDNWFLRAEREADRVDDSG